MHDLPSEPDVLFSLTGDVRRNSRALRQIRALAEMGCKVHVLTFGAAEGAPVPEPNVHFHDLPHPPGGGPRFFLTVHRHFREAALKTRARVYHASDLFTLPAMYAAARASGGRLVYDARELYPHVGAIANKPLSRTFWYGIERRYARRADAVFTVSQSIADWLGRHYGIAPPFLLPNVPPRQHVRRNDSLRRAVGAAADQVIVLYQGYLKPGRGCEPLLDAARETPAATLIFLGEGPLQSRLEGLARDYGIADRVHFLPLVPPDELLPVTASADIGACLIEDLSLSLRYALPNKLFEYLMAGLPVLGSNLPEIRHVVERFDVGRTVAPQDHHALTQVLREMINDAEARLRWSANTASVFETYSWEKASERFLEVYRRLLSLPPRLR